MHLKIPKHAAHHTASTPAVALTTTPPCALQDAIDVGLHLSRVFVLHARRSTHKPRNKVEEIQMLIYNYPPTFTANDAVMEPSYDGPDMTYFIDKEPATNATSDAVATAH